MYNENNNGFMSGWGGLLAFFVVLFFLGRGFGGGCGTQCNNGCCGQADIMDVINGQSSIRQGICANGYAVQGMASSLSRDIMSGNYNIARSIDSGVASVHAAIAAAAGENARGIADVKNSIDRVGCDIVHTITADGDKTRQLLTNYRMDDLQRKLIFAQNVIDSNAQTEKLSDRFGRFVTNEPNRGCYSWNYCHPCCSPCCDPCAKPTKAC